MTERPLDMEAIAVALSPAIEILQDALAEIQQQRTALLETINLIRQRAKIKAHG